MYWGLKYLVRMYCELLIFIGWKLDLLYYLSRHDFRYKKHTIILQFRLIQH